jgi:4'-phosphopantetheinyl transferase
VTLPAFLQLRWQRPGLSPAQRAVGLAILSPAELTRAGSDSFLQGRMLVRTLAGELLGIHPRAVPLSATCPDCGGPHGQPRIPGLSVSLAHCATAIVAVAALEGSVGVDVEPLHGSRERDAAIAEVAGAGGIRRWTSVEAVLKCDGRGLRVDPRSVHVTEGSATVGDARYALWHPELDVDLQTTVAWRS